MPLKEKMQDKLVFVCVPPVPNLLRKVLVVTFETIFHGNEWVGKEDDLWKEVSPKILWEEGFETGSRN